jgi:hypothetical protein
MPHVATSFLNKESVNLSTLGAVPSLLLFGETTRNDHKRKRMHIITLCSPIKKLGQLGNRGLGSRAVEYTEIYECQLIAPAVWLVLCVELRASMMIFAGPMTLLVATWGMTPQAVMMARDDDMDRAQLRRPLLTQ